MTPEQADLMAKAEESLQAARLLAEQGYHGFAVSRAYYSMFYVAQGLLEGEGLAFSSHAGVIAAFGHHFARTGRVPPEHHRHLLDAMRARHEGDYAAPSALTKDDAAQHVSRAEAFLRMAGSLLGPGPLPPEAGAPCPPTTP